MSGNVPQRRMMSINPKEQDLECQKFPNLHLAAEADEETVLRESQGARGLFR